jgi:hypothetical protein
LVVVVFVAVTAGIAVLLKKTDSDVGPALTVTTALLLVLVTAVYVRLTYRLVAAQEAGLRRSRQLILEASARELLPVVADYWRAVVELGNSFPMNLEGAPDETRFPSDEKLQIFGETVDRFHLRVGQLPGIFLERGLDAWTHGADVLAVYRRARWAILRECADALRAGRSPEWSEAKRLHASEGVPRLVRGQPEWESVAAGGPTEELQQEVLGLEVNLISFARG